MKEFVINITYPHLREVNPTEKRLVDILESLGPESHSVRMGDVSMSSYPTNFDHEKSNADQLYVSVIENGKWVVVYDSDNFYGLRGETSSGDEILVEDTGGVDWKMDSGFVVDRKIAIEKALELKRTGEISLDDSWEPFSPCG